MPLKKNLLIAVSLISTLAAGLVTLTLVGREARLVDLVGLFATGFGAGASLVAVLLQRQST